MLIAVASRDGREINQHFGHAERFLVYDVNGTEVKLVDEKKFERYCTYDQGHPLRAPVLRAIVDSLGECHTVVCAQIGQGPQMELEQLGIETFVADGPIKPTLMELAKLL